jgi:SAM-dependent methyltransferase
MPKATFDDYRLELEYQKRTWERKPILRLLYRHWYGKIVAGLAPAQPVVEIGSGCGNFKEFYPDCVATDVVSAGPWIDRIVDAHRLDFQPNSVGNLVAVDVIHHLQRPLSFLRQAEMILRPGGRLILCEPAVTPWSRIVYGLCHHEPLDMTWDAFGLDALPPEPDAGHTFANGAIGELLFWKFRRRTLQCVPSLSLRSAVKFGFLLYPLTGGFGYRAYLPRAGFSQALNAEDLLLRPFASWLTGLRMLVVLEKTASATASGSTCV